MMFEKFKLTVCTALFFLTTACIAGQTSKPESQTAPVSHQTMTRIKDSFVIGKVSFELIEKDDQCVLSYQNAGKKQELILNIAPPCRVVTDNNRKIRLIKYKDIKANVAMVVGSIALAAEKECGSQAQVFLVKNRTVALGKTQKGAVCVLYGTDEKDFWMLSH